MINIFYMFFELHNPHAAQAVSQNKAPSKKSCNISLTADDIICSAGCRRQRMQFRLQRKYLFQKKHWHKGTFFSQLNKFNKRRRLKGILNAKKATKSKGRRPLLLVYSHLK